MRVREAEPGIGSPSRLLEAWVALAFRSLRRTVDSWCRVLIRPGSPPIGTFPGLLTGVRNGLLGL